MVVFEKSINIFTVIILAFLCLLLSSCLKFSKDEFFDNLVYRNLYLIDVNDVDLYKDVRILGSINISYDELEERIKKFNRDYDFVFYCADYACTESDRAAKFMKSLGFHKTFVYHGGVQEWYQLSLKDKKMYPVEGPATYKFLLKPVEKFEREQDESLSAEELSKLLMSRRMH